MDTEQKYVDLAWFDVVLVDEDETRPSHHMLNEDVPVDGRVDFKRYYDKQYDDDPPDQTDEEGQPYWTSGSFPFRDHRKDDFPWEAFSDKPNFKQHPVWKWQNPERDPHENLTLNPSIGWGEPMFFHCYIRDGEVDWL